MGHKIIEAILEDGQLKYVNTKLPNGRLKVHLIYDVVEETPLEIEGSIIVRETSGIYKDISPDDESRKLKIEFLGWDKHTLEGFKKCKKLIEFANIYYIDGEIAKKAIELKKQRKIKLADAVIAAKALTNNFRLATKNVDDFKMIEGIEIINPFVG